MKKLAEHTPGPWRVHPDPRFPMDVVDEKNWRVARCAGTRGKYEIELANARLIASTPTLLETLKEVLARIEDMPDFIPLGSEERENKVGGTTAELSYLSRLIRGVIGGD